MRTATPAAAIAIQLLLVTLLWHNSASAQTAAVSGRVLERATSTAIAGATVRLGTATVLTDSRGEFRLDGLTTGSYELTVSALTYAAFTAQLDLRSDTTLVIHLDVNPLQLDSLRVAPGRITVQGYLTQPSGHSVMDATINATLQPSVRTKRAGHFAFRKVPQGFPFEIEIRAFAFEPVRISLVPERDTTLHIQLVPDTAMQRLIEVQSLRLEQRAVATVGKAFPIDQAELLANARGTLDSTLWAILRVAPYPTPIVRCVFVDERQTSFEATGMLFPEEVQRVELLFNGAMIRVYTRRFMANLVTSDIKLVQPGYTGVPDGMRRSQRPLAFCH